MPRSNPVIVGDIGGTNARFAAAHIAASGEITLDDPVVLKTSDYATLAEAWNEYRKLSGGAPPLNASFALAGPVSERPFKLTNNNWHFDPKTLSAELRLDRLELLNDFAAVAHCVSHLDHASLIHLAGPNTPAHDRGTTTIIGPGTGLGIAHMRYHEGRACIQATEGAHIDFAPVDAVDDALLARLRKTHSRVSLERVISGPGITEIYSVIAALNSASADLVEPIAIWSAGIDGTDELAALAVGHFIKTLGRVTGDYALAHGANRAVIAGGIGQRLRNQLSDPAFHAAFLDKGRYRSMMEAIPIDLVTHPQPGLLGAAAAFAQCLKKL
ncbi:MAG: glucokinase [Erythrobacter sp.]|uniref:glucokinase n=1 Tax=Marinobacter alexandrii TaxID=2570351 RepID=UPI0032970046